MEDRVKNLEEKVKKQEEKIQHLENALMMFATLICCNARRVEGYILDHLDPNGGLLDGE